LYILLVILAFSFVVHVLESFLNSTDLPGMRTCLRYYIEAVPEWGRPTGQNKKACLAEGDQARQTGSALLNFGILAVVSLLAWPGLAPWCRASGPLRKI